MEGKGPCVEMVAAAKDLACASGDTATCSALWIEIGRLDGMRNVLSEREGER